MKNKLTRLGQNQSGLVSIMVTVIIMLVITLVVIGFARVVRREQRQSLDDQLSTQAFYAAETGVNEAVKALTAPTPYLNDKSNCAPDAPPSPLSASGVIDAAGQVEYTCLLIDQSPPTLEKDNIDTNKSSVILIKPAASPGGPVSTVTLSWQNKAGPGPVNGCIAAPAPPAVPTFPVAGNWNPNCAPGVMRVDLVASGDNFTREDLAKTTMTVFLYPVKSGGVSEFDFRKAVGFGRNTDVPAFAGMTSEGQGAIIPVTCTDQPTGTKSCTIKFTQMSLIGTARASQYTLRAKSIYNPSALTVSAETINGPTELIGDQIIVDSTGRANDVLRRISVRVPKSTSNAIYPDFAIETIDSLCKRFSIAPGAVPVWDGADPACAKPVLN